jgi:toxin YoeB
MHHGTRMVKWRLVYTRQARKDAKQLATAGLKEKAADLLKLLERNPFEAPPPYEKLLGDLSGAYSRRINIQHRLVYQVLEEDCVIKVIRMWSHYE